MEWISYRSCAQRSNIAFSWKIYHYGAICPAGIWKGENDMIHKGTIPIKTERLLLRPLTQDDARPMFDNWANDSRVTEFLRWKPHGDISVTQDVLASWIAGYENSAFYQWGIELCAIGQVIGTIGAVTVYEQTETVHIGYCIGHAFWHHGYTSEALAALLSFFFEEVSVGRVESQHDPENPHSGNVMKKCGMRYEGTLRRADLSNRGIVDACMYGLTREDYFKKST